MSAVELAGLVADALQVKFAQAAAASTVVTTPEVKDWQLAHAAQFETTAQNSRPDDPTWHWDNPRKDDIAIRRIELTFNDKPDGTLYRPYLLITINDSKLFDNEGHVFGDNDLDLDLGGGVRLRRGESVKVYVWNKGTATGTRKITASVKAGAA